MSAIHRTAQLALATMLLATAPACDPEEPLGALVEQRLFPAESIPTVILAEATVTDGSATALSFEIQPADGGEVLRVPAVPGDDGDWTATLLGMRAASEYTIRAVAQTADASLTSADEAVVTGPQPPDLPAIELQLHDPERAFEGYLVFGVRSIPPTVAIVDREGEYVWWYRADESYTITRAALSRDRRTVDFMGLASEVAPSEDRFVERVTLDGTDVQSVRVPGAHHDFAELPDGSLAVIVDDFRTVEDDEVNGSAIREFRPDGSERVAWTSWDYLHYDPLRDQPTWTHANALDHDEARGLYHLSLRNQHMILQIDRGTGEVIWQVGGRDSDFALADGDTELFYHQHQFQWLGGGIVAFSNGAEVDYESRALEYTLDEATGEATLVWSFSAAPPLFCPALGDVTRLPSGNTLITYSTSGLIFEVTPDDELVLQLAAELGAPFTYVTRLDQLH